MSVEITMPKLSDTMEEGTLLRWHIGEGARVARGDLIAEVETDKAAMEMEAFEEGVVSSIRVAEGETVAVGTALLILEEEAAEKKRPEAPPEEAMVPPEEVAAVAAGISPAARNLAKDKGLNLSGLRGSGPHGRIVLSDVEGALGEVPPAEERAPGVKKSVKIRRIVARKMVESWQSIPHFYVTVAVDMTDVIRFRKDLGVSINDFVFSAAAHSLQEHPWVNSHWVDGEAVEQKSINIAMAVATDRGLYNPVITDCGNLSLREISRRAADLATWAHGGKLSQEDMADGTFTISNMGMLGVESFSAIITPPQAAVLAVGTVKGEVVVDDNGEPGIAPILRLTLSADHRILDGADAADFLATMKSYLEAPVTLIAGRGAEEGI